MSTLLRTGPLPNFTKLVCGNRTTHFLASPLPKYTAKTNLVGQKSLTNESLKLFQLSNFGLKAVTGITSQSQLRFAHTDIQFPDFTEYRRDSTEDPRKPQRDSEDQRRVFTYASYAVGGIIGLYGAKTAVRQVVAFKGPAEAETAIACTEIDISKIPEGGSSTFSWRGKPVFVRHRTQKEIDTERSVNLSELRDPIHDDQRVKKPEWLVVIGFCTHLSCVPIAGQGKWGGYYCPCHGSHYDASGRVRKGPAPRNLEVPDYKFLSDDRILIGESD